MPDERTRVDGSCRGGVMVGEQGHVEVDAVVPDARDLEGDRGDEAERARAVGEGADGAGSAFDLAMEALEAVRRAEAHPVRFREGEVGGGVSEPALETGDGLGELLAEQAGGHAPAGR